MARLLDYDPFTGISQWFDYDWKTKDTHISTVQDVEPILEQNKERQKKPERTKAGVKKDWMHAAHIPLVVQEHWLKKFKVDIMNKHHWPEVRKLLNSPDWAYLRCTPTGWKL
jgi:hypothetical protein